MSVFVEYGMENLVNPVTRGSDARIAETVTVNKLRLLTSNLC